MKIPVFAWPNKVEPAPFLRKRWRGWRLKIWYIGHERGCERECDCASMVDRPIFFKGGKDW